MQLKRTRKISRRLVYRPICGLKVSGTPLSSPPNPTPSSSGPCLPSSLFVKDKSVFGLRPGMMSMPPSAEQREVSIQSQGSVSACVRACVWGGVWVRVFESHQPAQKLIIQQECTRRWEEWACMCQKQKEWGGEESKGETVMRHTDAYWGLSGSCIKSEQETARRRHIKIG